MATSPNGRTILPLAELAAEYRHWQKEHERKGVESATRRALLQKMERTREQFERLLEHWVEDDALRAAWRKHFAEDGPPPDAPRLAAPPLYRGVTETGARVEVRPCDDGGYDVFHDGALESHETVPWHLDPDMIEPIQIGRHTCREIDEAPPEALGALAAFLATPNAEPPWQWARALFEDGLIDVNFALTPRGARRLGKTAPPSEEETPPVTWGVLLCDAARARLFVLRASPHRHRPTFAPLIEVSATTRPDQRARASELLADTRPGLRREGPHGPRHGVSDRRDSRRRAAGQRFAAQIAEEAARTWAAHGATRIVVVASPAMLGALRPALARTSVGATPWRIEELARDLTWLAPPALHDALAAEGLLPPRGRRPALVPTPGLPV